MKNDVLRCRSKRYANGYEISQDDEQSFAQSCNINNINGLSFNVAMFFWVLIGW